MQIRTIRGLTTALLAVAIAAVVALSSTMSTLVQLAVTTALVMGGTGMKALGDPHGWGPGTYLDQVNNTYLGLDPADLQWVQTPEHFWPATGLSDITFDASVAQGLLALDSAIATTPGSKIVVGYSQSANIATRQKRLLNELRAGGAVGVPDPDELSFVFVANPNRPNGGILARFEGLYIPILGVTFDGATPNDDYATIDIARQYDLIADFPLYPLNLLADINALMGYFYLHGNYGSDVINLADPSTYQSYVDGNTTYYLVHTQNLPLLQPLRDIGFPEPLLDLVEPTLRVLIELAYDRTLENMGVPMHARLLPNIDPVALASDLVAAMRQGVHDALDGIGIDLRHPEGHPTPALDDRDVTPVDEPAGTEPEQQLAGSASPAPEATEDGPEDTEGQSVSTDSEPEAEQQPEEDQSLEDQPETKKQPVEDTQRSRRLAVSPRRDVTSERAGSHQIRAKIRAHQPRSADRTKRPAPARASAGRSPS